MLDDQAVTCFHLICIAFAYCIRAAYKKIIGTERGHGKLAPVQYATTLYSKFAVLFLITD